MTDKIVPFTPKVTPAEEIDHGKADEGGYLYVCVSCGCRSWLINANKTFECANCKVVISLEDDSIFDGEWRKSLPPIPKDAKDDVGCIDVKHYGDTKFARRHVVKAAQKLDDAGQLAGIFAFGSNGASHGWTGAETTEQREWLVRKLKDYIRHFEAEIEDPTDEPQ